MARTSKTRVANPRRATARKSTKARGALEQQVAQVVASAGADRQARTRGGVVLPHARTSSDCVPCSQFHSVAEHARHAGTPARTGGGRRAQPRTSDPGRASTRASARPPGRGAARLSTRAATYRGEPGYRISGRDEDGQQVSIFVTTPEGADAVRRIYRDTRDRDERFQRVNRVLHEESLARGRLATAPPSPPSRPAPAPDQLAAELTQDAVRQVPSSGRFGADHVFISALYDRVGPRLGWSLDQFKRWLVAANRDQVVDLARADAQGDMDPGLVERSEILDRGAAFHFVVDRDARRQRRMDW